MPMMALSLAKVLSAAAMSGRRSSNCDGTPTGIGGGSRSSGFTGMEKSVAKLAEKHRDGVFILCSRNADVDRRGLRALQRGPRLHYGDVIVDAGVVAGLRQFERLLVCRNDIVQNLP